VYYDRDMDQNMAIMGWSSAEMAARYQHVLDSIRKGIADQVGDLLWGTPTDLRAWTPVAYLHVKIGRGRGIRTREGLPPTRFPSVRPRPLGESSAE
jgi:hypothetical protein